MPTDNELHKAAHEGDMSGVESLLAQGMKPDEKGASGRTALLRACGEGYKDVVELLLEKGADATFKDDMKRNALHYIGLCPKEPVDVCEQLRDHLKDKPDDWQQMLNTQSKSNSTPLHFALEHCHFAIAKFLASHGADIDSIKDENNKTCKEMAKEKKKGFEKELAKAAADSKK